MVSVQQICTERSSFELLQKYIDEQTTFKVNLDINVQKNIIIFISDA